VTQLDKLCKEGQGQTNMTDREFRADSAAHSDGEFLYILNILY